MNTQPQQESDSSFLMGLFLGAVTGAVVGLFIAPRSGAETRGAIRDQVLTLRDQAQSAATTARDQAAGAVHQATTHVADTAAAAKDQAQGAVQQAAQRVGDAAATVRDQVQGHATDAQATAEQTRDALLSRVAPPTTEVNGAG